MEKGIEKVTLELIKNKVPDEIVINSTGLTKEQLAYFKQKIKKEE